MSTIGKSIKYFGWRGIHLYYQLKTGELRSVDLPVFRNKIVLRKDTDDQKLFKQILIHREYAFKTPIIPEFIIDAGANIGLSAVYFATVFPDAQIIAIEAESNNFSVLKQNTSNYDKIKCVKAGLWHKSTMLEVIPSNTGNTGFMVNETHEGNPNGFPAISTLETLDNFNQKYIDLFKIDIEGAEKELLSDNTEWLDRTKIIIIELHDRKKPGCSQAFFNAFSHRNFECHPFGQNFLLFNKDLI